jgi:hypothetical protein
MHLIRAAGLPALLAVLLVADSVSARCINMAGVSVYASADAQYGFTLTKTGGVFPDSITYAPAATGRLFTFDIDARERVVWERVMVTPLHGEIQIAPTKYVVENGKLAARVSVVALDGYCNGGASHALVLYGPQGQVLADYRLEELLSMDQMKNVEMTSIGPMWREGAQTSFDQSLNAFVIRFKSGDVLRVDLETGRILPQP